MLHKYRAVKLVFFIQFNTTLPLSAAAERRFSVSGQIEATRCNKILDANSKKCYWKQT